jgi:hypothetical protein
VPLIPTPNGVATGDPSISDIAITDTGAVTWNGKDYSIVITDSATNTGEDIIKWLRYNFETGGAFQGKDGFNWHDLVQVNGDKFKTVRGVIYDTATLKGVLVLRGTDGHPDFNLFTADDGTTYVPPAYQTVTVSGAVAGSRVQIYDLTADEELYNDIPASFPFQWIDPESYVADREIRVRVMYADETTAKLFIDSVIGTSTATAPDLTYLVSQVADVVYAANGIDGSTVTDITIDDDLLLVNVDVGTITWAEIYAYETVWLYGEEGIRDEGRIIEAVDTANYKLTDFLIKNITDPTEPLVISGGYGVDSVSGETIDIIDTTGGTVFTAPPHVVAYATGSALTAAQDAKLTAIDATVPKALTTSKFIALK